MNIGYHGGVFKSFSSTVAFHCENAGIKALQIFMKSPQSWQSTGISSSDEKKRANFLLDAAKTKSYVEANDIFLVSHGCYLINMADPGEKALANAIDDLRAIAALGGKGSVFHLGKSKKLSIVDATATSINYVVSVIDNTLDLIDTCFIIETSAGQGSEMCTTIEQLGELYAAICAAISIKHDATVAKRIKLCVDTCHIFAAGYDISTEVGADKYIMDFQSYIGWENVLLVHLNDSLYACGDCKDRHASIGEGHIALEGLLRFIKQMITFKIPMILETPDGILDKGTEIAKIHSMLESDNNAC